MTTPPAQPPIVILTPVYEDWEALALLLPHLDRVAAAIPVPVQVIAVDDGSTQPPPHDFGGLGLTTVTAVDVLTLRRNVGHQRALAVGLCHIEAHLPGSPVVVMDADGEDDPADVPRLYQAYLEHQGRRAIFAERLRRSEGPIFAVFYHLYRHTHFALTGIKVRIGNFSIMPPQMLSRLVVVSELWNHYAASVVKGRIPYAMIPTLRATRLAGESRMNFTSLVTHGLSAMSVFSDRIGVRLITIIGLVGVAAIGVMVAVVVVRFFTSLAIPGWATYTMGLALLLLSQSFTLLLVFVFVVLSSRNMTSMLPARDASVFVLSSRRLFPPQP